MEKLVLCSASIGVFVSPSDTIFTLYLTSFPGLNIQVYSSTEHLATPSNLSFSSDRSHSEDKEDRGDMGGHSPSPAPADGSIEQKQTARMAR